MMKSSEICAPQVLLPAGGARVRCIAAVVLVVGIQHDAIGLGHNLDVPDYLCVGRPGMWVSRIGGRVRRQRASRQSNHATVRLSVQFETARARLVSWHLVAADLEAMVVVLDFVVIVVQAVATYDAGEEGISIVRHF